MKTCTLFACLVVSLCLAIAPAAAQIENIGPLTVFPQTSNVSVFTNLIPPNPSYKELEFTGIANVPAGAFGNLLVEFDYIDPNGMQVVVPAPTSMFTIIGGAPNPINTGILTLNFCPQVVSLHLTNQTTAAGVPIQITGQYRHQCFPVPEPVTGGWLGLASLGWCAIRRRRIAC
jgi:hypothetical protein